jgi:signal transduction histidine kinase/ActR/RegA family two-component response regulator
VGTQDGRKLQVRAEQVRLLYANANVGVGVTVLVASVLSFLQWQVIPHSIVLGWFVYMLTVSAARFALAQLYWRAPAKCTTGQWGVAFAVGAGLSGAGWGAASVMLYPEANLTNQVFLAFVVGGMMLGAVSLLAPRPEAFLAFIVPTGVPAAVRFLMASDGVHLAMGLLTVIFIVNILITTCHIYTTVTASLNLRFENKELVDDLQLAKKEAEELNQKLELRVNKRTAELHEANQRLRAEIEQREQAEDELVRARKLESLGVLVGGIAHDFNNFLTILQGNIDLAKMELARGNPIHDILEQTVGACRRAASLASQLLTFGKGGAPVRQVTSAARLIEDAVRLTSAGANVTIHVEIAEDLWSVDVDASQISHVLQNVLLNARQAMPEGGPIEVRAGNLRLDDSSLPLPAGKYISISIQDYGCGIPPDNLSRVFDPYFTTKQAGTGLGLAAAYAIVAKHQGYITVRSTVGVETTFTIYLPAGEYTVSQGTVTGEVLLTGSGRILVMDDEAGIRNLLVRMLDQLGYQVECASDGAEAIAIYEKALASGPAFDAVLLDLTVPGGMGGKDAAAKLREIDPSVHLIVASGYSDAPILSEFQKYGFDAVLRKPWNMAELSQVFRQVIPTGRSGS